MASKEKTSSPKTPSPWQQQFQHQHWWRGANILSIICPKSNEIFFFVQEKDVSSRRTNIVASGSLGKVVNCLYVCFLSFCLFVWKTLGYWEYYCFKLRPSAIHFLIIRHKSRDMVIKHKKKTSKEMRSTTETPSKREKIQSKETRLGKWAFEDLFGLCAVFLWQIEKLYCFPFKYFLRNFSILKTFFVPVKSFFVAGVLMVLLFWVSHLYWIQKGTQETHMLQLSLSTKTVLIIFYTAQYGYPSNRETSIFITVKIFGRALFEHFHFQCIFGYITTASYHLWSH